MNLNELRKEIDDIDDQMMELFKKRMVISKNIGKVKKAMGLPVFDPSREQVLLEKREIAFNDDTLWPMYKRFLITLFDLSKEWQHHE
ncbi:MAG: chorismate mutase [Tenericutes bacterium GWC2_34_14]|nr:MAG: chorismate mutase [Tenericutes bacterium GWA2_35_7]OHE29093.1 MAG: chorismate mutase [Tenericutes bacterium GWC2_34_14]OHE34053.1 MAG: chorismate mutase [Tenericutes bacterium GWE2_34_108]OHE35383.1 MAG: chorismate mutase [Tenericutes bacterium GWF1_35_14]OHE38471.1 MAG: chorismate mutase [Tenericutes bacterium GWF2_35_184]OHE43112.1 MAG: chorismate mutase [Tenericutes bacterium RIFOXYA2_FULL_36_32]OHE47028.1 MAG: chorismate mutase [Tenericutes bacterium RIFOXYA12_FULL_35_10]OHE47649